MASKIAERASRNVAAAGGVPGAIGRLAEPPASKPASKPTSSPSSQYPEKERRVVQKLSTRLIYCDKNIRREYSEESLNELASSIKEKGLLQPIGVAERESPDGSQYVVKYGHRRFLAVQRANIPYIDCIITSDYGDEIEQIVTQAIENEQRDDISAADREAYVLRLEELGLGREEICERLNKSNSWFTIIKKAHEAREKHGEAFKEAGIDLGTRDAYNLGNSTEEEVKGIIDTLSKSGKGVNKARAISKATEGKKKTDPRGRKKAPAPSVPRSVPEGRGEAEVEGEEGHSEPSPQGPIVSFGAQGPKEEDRRPESAEEVAPPSTTIKHLITKIEEEKTIKVGSWNNGGFQEPELVKAIGVAIRAYYEGFGYTVLIEED